MSECHSIHTPMDKKFSPTILQREKSENDDLEHRCRTLIGCIMYAMIGIRPDLCASVTFFSRFQSCASNELWVQLKRLLRYIKSTLDTIDIQC